MKNAEQKIFPDNPAVATAFAADFHAWTEHSPHDGKVTVALSGGSTPKLLFQTLAANYSHKIDWSRIHFFWGDERMVAPTDGESNYGMTKELLLDHISIPTENVHRVLGENDPTKECSRYEEEIRQHVRVNEQGVPAFDLMILGMGGDGHTASIFPHESHFLSSERLCEVATHPESGQKRITLTGQILNASADVAFLITGDAKAPVLAEIKNGTGRADSYPAAHISNDGPMTLYLDQAAASQL